MILINEEKVKIREQAEFRAERNAKLSEADIMINKAEDKGEDTSELRAYRQALRDATINWVLPEPEFTEEELLQQENQKKIAKFKQFLADTDYKVLPDYDQDSTEVKVKRQEAREFIRANEGDKI